jgi:hypothetical protein
MAPEEVDGEVAVGISGTTQGKVGSSSNRSPRGSGDSRINASENGGKEKDKDKSEDKDNKAWQEGDFAYEYVQLAQVRQAFMSYLHFTTQSIFSFGAMAQTSPVFHAVIFRDIC